MTIQEKNYKPFSGFLMFVLYLFLLAFTVAGFFVNPIIGIPLAIVAFLYPIGFFVVNPNESKVLILFGQYKGTAREAGFHWVNPFFTKKHVSLRARNLNGHQLKVNDKLGNPIEIAVVLVWRVEDTAKAVLEVDDYNQYVVIQSESAVRHLANSFAYDSFEDDNSGMTLRDSADQVNEMLLKELNERLERAGIHVLEGRISHLAYAPEIAGAMLQRQQATAVVAARRQIVEGAVGMVEMALAKLSEKEIVHLDEERKAAMVSNLLVVLCGDKSVHPVVNTGTLY
jgi:regulator of protease activity HflC (stomatin/prohibitin superfamily)